MKIKILIPQFLGNVVMHIQAKYRKDQMKTEGAYSIWKKSWRTDRRFGIR